MIRIPRNSLKTKGDFERAHDMALNGELRPRDIEQLKRYWKSLLGGRWRYDRDRKLDTDEDPDGEEPEYRVMAEQTEDDTEERWQYKRVEDGKARLHKLGFDVPTVEAKIAELEDLE